MRFGIFVVLCCIAAPALADATDARALIVECIDNASTADLGLEKLEGNCPGLGAAVVELAPSEHLTADWREGLTLSSLEDLLALQDRYSADRPFAPDTSALPAVLRELADAQATRQPTWWDRIKAWLRKVMQAEASNQPNWLAQLVDKLPQIFDILKIVSYICIALVVALAGWIVYAELRAAGLLKRRDRAGIQARAAVLGSDSTPEQTSFDIDGAPLHERPALLLRLLVRQLIRRGQLRAELSLTHRELVGQAQFTNAQDSERFKAVSLLAEGIRYGGRGREDAQRMPEVLDGARQLYEQLRDDTGRPQS